MLIRGLQIVAQCAFAGLVAGGPCLQPAAAQPLRDRADTELRATMARVRGGSVDRIPAIDRPVFTDAADAGRFLRPGDKVVGLRRGGEKKAYPLVFLDGREVVNDSLGGDPVTVTW